MATLITVYFTSKIFHLRAMSWTTKYRSATSVNINKYGGAHGLNFRCVFSKIVKVRLCNPKKANSRHEENVHENYLCFFWLQCLMFDGLFSNKLSEPVGTGT